MSTAPSSNGRVIDHHVEYEQEPNNVPIDAPCLSWCVAPSPILENDIYEGEVYDAREECGG